jgi:glycosyltransferase involved in cell wall biosynthesis
MHVLFLLYSLEAGGAQRVTITLANHWWRRGHRVSLVTWAPAALDFYAFDPGIERISMRVTESGGGWHGLQANLQRWQALRRLLRRCRPDVAIALMPSSSVLLALARLGLPGPVVVGSERTHPPAEPLGRIWSFLRWLAYGWLDAVVAQTHASALWLRQHTRARQLVVIANPLPPQLPASPPFLLPEQLLLPGDNLILAAGRLSKEKGFDLLLLAFARVAPDQPNWRLVILGEGPERTALEQQVQALGLQAQVLLPGRAGNIAHWYKRAELFVLSSRYEGFPNVLAEAMAAGVAVVSSDCSNGPADLVRDGIDGCLVPSEDPAALAQALAVAMADDALRRRWAAQARQLAMRLDVVRIAEDWEAMFAQLGLA